MGGIESDAGAVKVRFAARPGGVDAEIGEHFRVGPIEYRSVGSRRVESCLADSCLDRRDTPRQHVAGIHPTDRLGCVLQDVPDDDRLPGKFARLHLDAFHFTGARRF